MKQTTWLLVGSIILFLIASAHVNTPTNAGNKLDAFISKDKFKADTAIFYPGVSNQALQSVLTNKINLAAADFKAVAGKPTATDKDYQNKIASGLERFSDIYLELNTSDRERICYYFEELMDIVGLENSGGHLNNFMYGFNPKPD